MTGWEAVASTGSSGEWHLGPDALQRETELAAPEQATVGAGRGTTPEANGTEENVSCGKRTRRPVPDSVTLTSAAAGGGEGSQRELPVLRR